MKGLLLKDWYMMKNYCKSYLVIAAGFIALSFVSHNNMFFAFYPCMLCGMIPANLLGYDERSRWMQYSGTMPYTKTQIVSGKYIIGLFTQLAMLVAAGTAQAIRMMAAGQFIFGDFLDLMLLLLVISTLTSSLFLPFIFKLGAEKGRTIYYPMIGFVCGASFMVSGLMNGRPAAEIKHDLILGILAVVGVGIYFLSWHMSIVFYKKREIQ